MKNLENDLVTFITKINNSIIVSIPGEMTDDEIKVITDLILSSAYRQNVKGAIFDFSIVKVMDHYTFTAFDRITKSLCLIGVKAVWVGLKPGVVSALMDLDVAFEASKIQTASSLEYGLQLLKGVR